MNTVREALGTQRVLYNAKVHDFHDLLDWLKENCKGKRYIGQGFDNWIDFENEQDATFFALRWGG